jgi:UDP-N-acetylmuramoyl-tripeptide--D-alanyl-D-alanine ligase
MNTETGLPLSILGYKEPPEGLLSWLYVLITAPFKAIFSFVYPKILVLEYAADKPGDIKYLLSIAEPDIAVITNFGVAHIEAFKSRENIAREKWQLALAARSKIVCPENVFKTGVKIEYPRADIFTPSHKTVIAVNARELTNKTEFKLVIFGKERRASFDFFGAHNIENLEIAALAALSAGVSTKRIFERIEGLHPQAGRGQRLHAPKDILILDESYNANPASMLAALKVFSKINHGRAVAILGEMKEIGPISTKAHLEVAKYAKAIADLTVGVGEAFRSTNLEKWYPNVEELIKDVRDLLEPGDSVLVKGSHSNHLEKFVEEIQK